MNDVSIRDVVRNPEWLPHAYDADGQTLTFVHVPRAARSELMFLFDEHFAGRFAKMSFDGASVASAVAAGNPVGRRRQGIGCAGWGRFWGIYLRDQLIPAKEQQQ